MQSLTSWDILGTVEQLDQSEQEEDKTPLGIIITNPRTLVKVSIKYTFIYC